MSSFSVSKSLVCVFFLVLNVTAAPFSASIQYPAVSINATITTSTVWPNPTGVWLGPKYRWHFASPLPIPPVKQPKLYASDSFLVTLKRLTHMAVPILNLILAQLWITMRLRWERFRSRFSLIDQQQTCLLTMAYLQGRHS